MGSVPPILKSLSVLGLLLICAGPAAAVDNPAPGWRRLDIPATSSYVFRYVPQSLDRGRPAPVVLFFHGSGTNPNAYRAYVVEAAEAARCIVALPKSASNLGWGTGGDEQTVAESLRLLREEISIDDSRIAVAGHSAGGAYAYLLAYTTRSGYSAVFSLASRYYPVSQVADPHYKAPIRMYYGTADPNYTGGSYDALKRQWDRLGVPWEEDIQPGLGHGDLPAASMAQGFLFLASKTYLSRAAGCVPTATALCLGGGRFRVEVSWRDSAGRRGAGTVVPVTSEDSGLFWFFDPANWELLVKVLNGCARNGHYWVFAAATTNVEYTLTVTDTETGQTATYQNPLGRTAPAVTDTGALECLPPAQSSPP